MLSSPQNYLQAECLTTALLVIATWLKILGIGLRRNVPTWEAGSSGGLRGNVGRRLGHCWEGM